MMISNVNAVKRVCRQGRGNLLDDDHEDRNDDEMICFDAASMQSDLCIFLTSTLVRAPNV